jgi:hypothetical protein
MLGASPSAGFIAATGRTRKVNRTTLEDGRTEPNGKNGEENNENETPEMGSEGEKYLYKCIKEERQAASREKERSMLFLFSTCLLLSHETHT